MALPGDEGQLRRILDVLSEGIGFVLALAACVPLLVALVGTAARVNARVTALLALVSGCLVAAFLFPQPFAPLWGSFLGMLPTLAEVLCIILGGLMLSRILDAAGAPAHIAKWCEHASSHRSSAALLVVLGIESFCESVTGFGVGVTIAVPILRHLGFSALSSATMAMLGLVVTVWGGLSPGTIVAAELAGLDVTQLGIDTAWTVWPSAVVAGLAVVWIAHPSARPGHLHLVEGAFTGLILAFGILLANMTVGTPLAGAIGSLITVVALLIRFRLGGDRTPKPPAALVRSAVPYAILIGGLLPLNVAFRLAQITGPLHLLASPALWLLLVSAISVAWFAFPRSEVRAVVARTLHAWRPVAFLTTGYMVLGWLLTASGMSETIADAAARLGVGAVALVPVFGAVGGFLTGSNTGANAMFAGAVAHLGTVLGLSPSGIVGATSQAGAIGSAASPARIALAAGLSTEERAERDALMRALLPRMILFNLLTIVSIAGIVLLGALWR